MYVYVCKYVFIYVCMYLCMYMSQRMNDVLQGIGWDLLEIQAALAATKSDLSLNTVQEEKVIEWETLTKKLAVMKSQLETASNTSSEQESKLVC